MKPLTRIVEAGNEFGLTPQIIGKIHTVLLQFPLLERAILYGSRAKGSFRNGSDIDLTLVGDQLTHSDLRQIEDRLDDLYLAYSFDVSLLHHIENHDLIKHIERVGKEFFTRET